MGSPNGNRGGKSNFKLVGTSRSEILERGSDPCVYESDHGIGFGGH